MGRKGRKSVAGEPEIWGELKQRSAIMLTPTALRRLNEASIALGISRSELVERLARSAILDELVKIEPLESEQYVSVKF